MPTPKPLQATDFVVQKPRVRKLPATTYLGRYRTLLRPFFRKLLGLQQGAAFFGHEYRSENAPDRMQPAACNLDCNSSELREQDDTRADTSHTCDIHFAISAFSFSNKKRPSKGPLEQLGFMQLC
jgi:hypothetical protein